MIQYYIEQFLITAQRMGYTSLSMNEDQMYSGIDFAMQYVYDNRLFFPNWYPNVYREILLDCEFEYTNIRKVIRSLMFQGKVICDCVNEILYLHYSERDIRSSYCIDNDCKVDEEYLEGLVRSFLLGCETASELQKLAKN